MLMVQNEAFTLEELRLLNKFTMEYVGNFIGVHAQTYAKIEKNPDRATLFQAKKLAQLYGRSVDSIFFGS